MPNKIAPRVSLPHTFDPEDSQDTMRLKMAELIRKLEDYLNAGVGIFIITARNQRLPIFRQGDVVFDFSANRGFATLQQWDGKKLVPLALASTSIVGLINLITQGTGSGIDPTMYLKSDGANGWMLAPITPDFDPAGSHVLAAVNLAAFDPVTINGNKADSTLLSPYGRVFGIVTTAVSTGFIGTVIIAGEITNGGWSWSPNDKIFLNGTALSTTPPTSGFAQKVAVAKTATTIVIELGPPVLL